MYRYAFFTLLLAGLAPSASPATSFRRSVQPVLAKHCLSCHNDRLNTGGLSLQSMDPADEILLEKISAKLRSKTMPPPPVPPPPSAQVQVVQKWLDSTLAAFEKRRKPVAGRVTARRLNRAEYNNTIRDLLAVDFRPADDFPSDDSGYGFDNNGDVLTVSPVLMEKYLAAAESITAKAITVPRKVMASTQVYRKENDRFVSDITATHVAPLDAEYQVNIFAAVTPKRDKPQMPLSLILDGTTVHEFVVDTTPNRNRVFTARIRMTQGKHALRAVLVEEAKMPDQDSVARTRASIDGVEVQGPYNAAAPLVTDSHKRIFICGLTSADQDSDCARKILANFARRAFRRPVTDDEVLRYQKLFDSAISEGDGFEASIEYAVQAMLVSPQFLFRIESDSGTTAGRDRALNPFELASRLSYFLWSSMPDEKLFAAAESGALAKPAVLKAQVRRMLMDSRTSALVENFAGQWLQVRNLEKHKPDPSRFPDFDEKLRGAMLQETYLFIASMIKDDGSILDLIDGKYTYLNERLAKHYGVKGVSGEEFRKVALTGASRGGVLTQASVLTVTSYEGRTSPVSRGKWLLQNVLGAPPPPPPADVPALEEKGVASALTLRQQMEQHRANPACASCHVRMDPLGFSLENFDAIGAWRTMDGKSPIDASGVLPGGRTFNGPVELKAILLEEKDAFAACLAEKLLTYALGRGVERADQPVVKDITRKLAANNYRFSTLVLEVVRSMPFRMKHVEDSKVRSSL